MTKFDSLQLDGLSHFIVLGKRSDFSGLPKHLLILDRYELANTLRPFTTPRASDLPRLKQLYRRVSPSQKMPEADDFAGHFAAALLAAGYCGVKVKKDVAGPSLPVAAVSDIKPVEVTTFHAASPEDKYARVLELVPQHLPGEMKGAFAELVSPEAIGVTVAILVVWAGSHAIGVGFAIDVLLIAIGFAMVGWSIFGAVGDVIEFFEIMESARSDADLNRAAQKLAGAIAALGVGTFIALLTRGAGRIAAARKANVARKPKGGGGAPDSRPVPQSALPKTENRPRKARRKASSDLGDESEQVGKVTEHSGTVDKLDADKIVVTNGGVGSLSEGAFAQIKAKPTKKFSKDGKRIYSDLAGEPIETVQDLTNAIKSGKVNPADIEVNYVVVNGKPVIDNTRTSTALTNAGVPQSKWNGVNQTGKEQYPGRTWDEAVQDKINNNKGEPISPEDW